MPMEFTGLTPLISVHDMVEAIGFYCGLLGFEIVDSSPEIDAPEGRYFHWAWIRLGQAELMLNTAWDAGERPETRDAGRERGHPDTCLYIGCSDPDQLHARLTSKGLRPAVPTVAPYGMRQLHLTDPDGYGLCFQAPA